jgi:hypothetical protein
MRRPDIILFLLSLVIIWIVVVSYLAATGPSTTLLSGQQNAKKIDIGLLPLPEAGQFRSVAFEEAVEQLPSFLLENRGVSSNITIHYMRANNLDYDGKASKWLLGIRYDNESALMYYDASGWQSVPWKGELPEREIIVGSFIPPGELIRKNTGIIASSNPTQKDLIKRMELGNGIYTVTVYQQDKQQTLVFDAGSGALIPSYA